MRCTVGQWQTGTGKLAVFVGSSVRHVTAVAAQLSDNGNGVNRLASGFFGKVPGLPDHRYFKGNHGTDRHLAFRNESKLPVWRTSDDTDYEGDDRLEFEVVYDNLHCSRQINETASYCTSSYGCVVVAGKEGDSGATSITTELGPWKKFLNNAYRLDQFRSRSPSSRRTRPCARLNSATPSVRRRCALALAGFWWSACKPALPERATISARPPRTACLAATPPRRCASSNSMCSARMEPT